MVHEGVDVPQDRVGETQIEVAGPDAGPPPDAGTEPQPDGGPQPGTEPGPLAVSRGCSQAGAPWLAFAALFLLLRSAAKRS